MLQYLKRVNKCAAQKYCYNYIFAHVIIATIIAIIMVVIIIIIHTHVFDDTLARTGTHG